MTGSPPNGHTNMRFITDKLAALLQIYALPTTLICYIINSISKSMEVKKCYITKVFLR